MRILVLGGTADARAVADGLAARGVDVVTSLAGRTRTPLLPAGEVRVGGFGGVPGLLAYLRGERIDKVVNATHPFAERMSRNAYEACAEADVPLLRLDRPGWSGHPDASRWTWVASHTEAAEAARRGDGAVWLTVGRQHAGTYVAPLAGRTVVCRVALAAGLELPDTWRLVEAVGPFSPDDEARLIADHRIGVLVTKDSGGVMTAAKLTAAAESGVAVVMIRRPECPGERCATPDEALAWVTGPGGGC